MSLPLMVRTISYVEDDDIDDVVGIRSGVMALRMMKLMRGGRSGRREAVFQRKVRAAFEATASLMARALGDEIVHRYRRRVAANAKGLGGLSTGTRK